MKLAIGAFMLGMVAAPCAFAQVDDDVMEVQRCVWRCQAEFGAASQRYGQCVNELCSGKPQRKQTTATKLRKQKSKSTKRRVIRNSRGDVLIRRVN